jgi:DnaK suppressor protein
VEKPAPTPKQAPKEAPKASAKAAPAPKAVPAVKAAPQQPPISTAKAGGKSAAKSAAPASKEPTNISIRVPSTTPPAAPKLGATKPVPPGKPLINVGKLVQRTEEDEEGGGSALRGPRNFKPYQLRKDEEYMNLAQVEHFRTLLETWKRELMEEVDRTVTHMKDEAANPPDPNDRATLESEFGLELRTRDRERKLIRKIDEAIKRIEDSTYGYCLETGEEIGVKRLEARPVATLCLEAQERRERRERQYGDRDDRYRIAHQQIPEAFAFRC